MHFLANIKAKAVAAGLLPKSRKKLEPEYNGLPPLNPINLPHILPEHTFALSDQGWSKITYEKPVDRLQSTSQTLFQASKSFFDLPAEQKEKFKTRSGTEEGWNHVPGEKEFITLRSLERIPDELKDAADSFWAVAGELLDDLIKRIAESLDLSPDALGVYSEPCVKLGIDKTATLLRLFRYESSSSQTEMKTVAEGKSLLEVFHIVVAKQHSSTSRLRITLPRDRRHPWPRSLEPHFPILVSNREILSRASWLCNGRPTTRTAL